MNWLNQDLFNDYLAMRIEAKLVKVNTQRSINGLLSKLEKWYHMGYNIDAILEHATELQWRGLWMPKGFEPSQRHLKSDLLSNTVKDLVNAKRLPPPKSSVEKQRAADEARRRALEIVRSEVK